MSLNSHRADGYGCGLCRDIGTLPCVLESLDSTGSEELRHSWCIRYGYDGIVLGNSNVTNGDVLEGFPVDQHVGRVGIRKDLHPGTGINEREFLSGK